MIIEGFYSNLTGICCWFAVKNVRNGNCSLDWFLRGSNGFFFFRLIVIYNSFYLTLFFVFIHLDVYEIKMPWLLLLWRKCVHSILTKLHSCFTNDCTNREPLGTQINVCLHKFYKCLQEICFSTWYIKEHSVKCVVVSSFTFAS